MIFYILSRVCTLCNSTVEKLYYDFYEGVENMGTYAKEEKQSVIDRVIFSEPSIHMLSVFQI